jgi:histidinol-phosphate aminotransferase
MSDLRLNVHLASLPVYIPGRPIEEVARELGLDPGGIIKLASNENPFGPSPKAVQAIIRAASQAHLYPDGSAFELKRRIGAKLRLDPSQLILGNGSNEILELIGHAFLEPGDEVLAPEHCFAVYPIVAALFGAKLVLSPSRAFGADIDALLARVTARTRVIFLANPNNPTGTLTPREDLRRLLAAAPRQALVVLDEAYVEFLDEPFESEAHVRDGSAPNLMIVRTFSKVYGLAGLRVGFGAARAELIAAMEKARQPFNLNAVAQAAALAALDDEEHLLRTSANNRGGLDRLHTAFAELGLPFVRSFANFVMVNVGDGIAVFGALQRRGIIVRPLASYGLREWVRVTVGTPSENERFLDALRSVLQR